jgi:hypothetical protein
VLVEPDFGGARLERVEFVDCVLKGADFTGATLTDVDLRRAAEVGIARGVDRLSGAVISPGQLLDLAGVFAGRWGFGWRGEREVVGGGLRGALFGFDGGALCRRTSTHHHGPSVRRRPRGRGEVRHFSAQARTVEPVRRLSNTGGCLYSARPAFEDEAVQGRWGSGGAAPRGGAPQGRHAESGQPGEAGLKQRPDRRILAERIVQVNEVGEEIVQEVPRLAAEFGVGEGQRLLVPGIQSASMSTHPKRRSNSMRSVDSVKSSSARCGRDGATPPGPVDLLHDVAQRPREVEHRHPSPGCGHSRSALVSARYTSPQNRSCRSAWTSARR